jgi:hypothetical protein
VTEDVRQEAPPTIPGQTDSEPTDFGQELYLTWADNHDYVDDLIGPAEQVGDRPSDPEDTLGLACSAALASTALGKALEQEFSLYTPQDAAVVAGALQDQLRTTVANLHRLTAATRRIATRGDMHLPPISGFVDASEEHAEDALGRLGIVADQVESHIDGLRPAILVLDDASTRFEPPANSHEALRAVVSLLDEGVEIVGDGPAADHVEEMCGCTAVIKRADDTYYLSYGDLGWELLRDSEGAVHADGSKSWVNGGSIDLDVSSAVAHPRHIATQVQRALGDG